ncbi:MAG: hypothetical protein NTW21_05515 [Verrucomicrobia bacterium]|nr:hypothetical protein [Verrucomicrobiota bacterium]
MNTNNQAKLRWPVAVAAMFVAGALHADPVIDEPFAQPVGTRNGQAAGTFSTTRHNPLLSGLKYTIRTSTTLESGSWIEDPAASASQVPGTPNAIDFETVAVILSAAPVNGKLFVRVQATK